jgi:hypothetical protein
MPLTTERTTKHTNHTKQKEEMCPRNTRKDAKKRRRNFSSFRVLSRTSRADISLFSVNKLGKRDQIQISRRLVIGTDTFSEANDLDLVGLDTRFCSVSFAFHGFSW